MDALVHFFAKLAGSKLWSVLGGIIAIIGTICTTMRDDVIQISPVWGLKVCAIAAILGVMLTMLGRGVADRRDQADTQGPKPEGLMSVADLNRRVNS